MSSDRPSVEMKKIDKKSDFWVGRLKRYVGNLNKDFQYFHKFMILVTFLALQIHKNGIQQEVSQQKLLDLPLPNFALI